MGRGLQRRRQRQPDRQCLRDAVAVGHRRQGVPVATTTAADNGAGAIQGTTALQGGFAPLTGTITFTVTGPNDQWCAGTPVYTRTVPVNGAGSYASGWFTPTVAGTYTYRIRPHDPGGRVGRDHVASGRAPGAGLMFHGPTRCVRRPFHIDVAGGGIRQVTFYIAGKAMRTVTRADRRGRFTATVGVRGLRRRVARSLTAKVVATAGLRVLHRSFTVCT